MIKLSVLFLSKMIKKISRLFNKIAENLEQSDKPRIVKKGTDRDLYRTQFNDLFWLGRTGYVEQHIARYGYFEYHSTQIVKKIVKNGNIVFDVGANIGYYTVLFSKLAGEKGQVFCFEPTRYFRNLLNRNLETNDVKNVEIFPFGLSNKKQELEIEIGDTSATLHSPGKHKELYQEIIELISLDEFMEKQKLPTIDFIKIDIDGHEPLFLEGAWKTIDKFNPIILMEINHLNYFEAGFTAWDFYKDLKRKNFKIYHEDGLKEIKTLEEFLIRCGNFAYSSNIVISRRELGAELY